MVLKSRKWLIVLLAITLIVCGGWLVSVALGWTIFSAMNKTPTQTPTIAPTAGPTDSEIWAVAVVLTYEAQIFPEPYKTQAYTAIAWTMRNRIDIGFGGAVSYTDDRLLSRYSSYADHKNDPPDPRALDIARQVLSAQNNLLDPTHGARHYVDNSYWTGTHDQIGATVAVRGKFSDTDLQRLIDSGAFDLMIEWRTVSDNPKFYGLYFFDNWPPVTPIVTPTFTPTRKPTATLTRTFTPTRTLTPTITPRLSITPIMTATIALTPTITMTPTILPTEIPTPEE